MKKISGFTIPLGIRKAIDRKSTNYDKLADDKFRKSVDEN
jgi:hypothetical protein